MINRLVFLLILKLLVVPDVIPQGKSSDLLLREEVAQSGQALVKLPFPGKRILNDLSRILSIATVKGKEVEIFISPLTVDWFILQKFDYEIMPRVDPKSIITATSLTQALEWDTYPTYEQYVQIMQDFETAYPDLCNLDTIGTSIYGKLVLVLKISDNPATDEDEPEVFYSSTIHGNETGGYILMLRLADYLLKNYNTLPRIKTLVDNLEIWINPLANPDGTYKTGNEISSPTRYNANGYDLNRNFPDPITPNTTKQKETLDMVRFMRGRDFVLSANFHSGAEVVNYPWDRWPQFHADNDWYLKISRKYADTVHQHAPVGYMNFMENGVTNGYEWYSIYGGRQDFITWELQGREVTIEIDDNYVAPVSSLNLLWDYNWRSLLGYLENALFGIHGRVIDKYSAEPVPAKVFIVNYDKDSSHIYSDTLTGSFVRMLTPGTWDLVFSASGYLDKHVDGIVVTDGEKTEITVEMIPFVNPIDTVETPSLLLYPNPARELIKVILPSRLYGKVDVRIVNYEGVKMVEYGADAYEDTPLYIDVRSLVPGAYTLLIRNISTKQTERCRFVVVR